MVLGCVVGCFLEIYTNKGNIIDFHCTSITLLSNSLTSLLSVTQRLLLSAEVMEMLRYLLVDSILMVVCSCLKCVFFNYHSLESFLPVLSGITSIVLILWTCTGNSNFCLDWWLIKICALSLLYHWISSISISYLSCLFKFWSLIINTPRPWHSDSFIC